MSGIEVIGLILGGIPLIISAMEHYADGVSTLGRYRRYKLELQTLINSLSTEKANLMDTCEKLLLGIVPPWEIETMTEDPFGNGRQWENREIQDKIRRRLYKNYAVFKNNVKDVHAAIQELQDELQLQPDGRVKWVEGNTFMRQIKRVTFSLHKDSYAELIERIRVGLTSLGQLTKTSIELEPERQVRSQGRLLRLVRDTSKSIYRALKGSLTCHGAHDHDLNLGLAVRSAKFDPYDDDEKICSQFKFNIAISTCSDRQSASSPMKTWDEVEVKEAAVASTRLSIPADSSSLKTHSSKKAKGKAVSFALTECASTITSAATIGNNTTTVTATTTTTSASANMPSWTSQQLSAAEAMSSIQKTMPLNLCQSLYKARKQLGDYCGCVVDTKISKAPREYHISLTTSSSGMSVTTAPITPAIHSTLSLRQVLENRSKNLPPLTFDDRLYLATVISSSVLQLHQTPWLAEIVSSEDIMFVQRGNTISYRHAFVRRQPDSQAAGGSPGMGFTPRNPMVLSLGVLLVEIILGKPVHNGKGYSGQHNLLSNYTAAYEHLNEVDQKGSQNYGSAVRRCLNYRIPTDSQDMGDERFRHDAYRTIVALLERDLSYVGIC